MSWRVAYSLMQLRAEVNTRWPSRAKESDGMIGDAAHQAESRSSDHNPWVHVGGQGVVRAWDITSRTIDAEGLANYLRGLGKAGDHRLASGGYVIYNHRIASATGGWAWRGYSGASPHTEHIHVSVSRSVAGFDSRASWGVQRWHLPVAASRGSVRAPVAAKPLTYEQQKQKYLTDNVVRAVNLKPGAHNWDVIELQNHLNAEFATKVPVDGVLGPRTRAQVVAFQKRKGLAADGIVGPRTGAALGLRVI